MGNTLRQTFAVSVINPSYRGPHRDWVGGHGWRRRTEGRWRILPEALWRLFFGRWAVGLSPSFGNGAAAVGAGLPSWRLYLITRERNSFEIHTIWVHWRARIYKHFSAGRPSHRVASF